MKRIEKVLCISTIIFLYICFLGKVYAQEKTVAASSVVSIPFSDAEITSDGNLEDWENYFEMVFTDTSQTIRNPVGYEINDIYDEGVIENILFPISRNTVTIRLCWNLDNLNVAFVVADKHLFAEYQSETDNPFIYLNDGVEIYIDSHADSKKLMDSNDYQFMVDVLDNTTVFRGNYHQMGDPEYAVPKDHSQNILFYHSVKKSGIFNDSLGNDTGFVVELIIPFASIGLQAKTGQELRMDLCNNDNDHFLDEYKIIGGKIPFTWPFNWSGYNDYGYPEAWRTAILMGSPSWLDKASLNMKKSWLLIFVGIVLGSVIIFLFLFFRINKLRKMPREKDVGQGRVLFVRGEETTKKVLTVNQQYLQKAGEYIAQKAETTINSEEVAGHLNISLRKFQRLTKEEMNCTPTNFIWIVKLNLAAEFIKNNQGSISDAAYKYAFSSPSYFSKLFKEYFGSSPLDYKKNV